jgi:hypothetical protein
MRRKAIVLMTLNLACALAWAAPAPGQGSGERALADLNAWRAELRLPALARLDAAMSDGCRLHNRYMALNPLLAPTHDELLGTAGFSAAGQATGRTSVIASAPEAATPRELWEFAPFHRVALLDPRLRTTWWALSDGFACMGVVEATDGTAATPAIVGYPSPADGATGVPTGSADLELPDPRDLVPGRPSQIGWPLTVSFNGPWRREPTFTLTAATLATAAGEAVPVTGVDSGVGHGAVVVLPREPLVPSTDYVARVAGFATGGAGFDVTWRFRTADELLSEAGAEVPSTGGRKLPVRVHTRRSGRRLAVMLTVPSVAAGRKATVGLYRSSGRRITSRRLVLASTTRTTLRMPARGSVTLRVTVPRYASGIDAWGDATLRRVIRR